MLRHHFYKAEIKESYFTLFLRYKLLLSFKYSGSGGEECSQSCSSRKFWEFRPGA